LCGGGRRLLQGPCLRGYGRIPEGKGNLGLGLLLAPGRLGRVGVKGLKRNVNGFRGHRVSELEVYQA